ncbi:MAG: hypothetical protein INR70_17850 [Parafilimonas terrae]|nr:hypothetical protein [Parafilimonas terrae]
MDREGLCMGHCVGDGDYDEYAGSEEMADDAIWSLRRPDGVSVLTVKVDDRQLNYAKGPMNSYPRRFAAMQVAHLVAGFKEAGHEMKVNVDTEIVLLEDGRTFRVDRLPPDVVEAREAAARERWAAARERARREVRIEMQPIRSWPMMGGIFATFNPDAEWFGDVDHLRPEFRATMGEPDPVVQIQHDVGGPFRYRTRAGIEFELAPASVPGMRDVPPTVTISSFVRAFMEAYRAAVGQAPTPVPEATRAAFVNAWQGTGWDVSIEQPVTCQIRVDINEPSGVHERGFIQDLRTPEETLAPRRRDPETLGALVTAEDVERMRAYTPAAAYVAGAFDAFQGVIAYLAPERFGSVTLRPDIIQERGPRG